MTVRKIIDNTDSKMLRKIDIYSSTILIKHESPNDFVQGQIKFYSENILHGIGRLYNPHHSNKIDISEGLFQDGCLNGYGR